jgi:hypothetical protein
VVSQHGCILPGSLLGLNLSTTPLSSLPTSPPPPSPMSEDSRAGKPKRKVLVVVNPSESDDDRKEHSNRPNGTARMTNAGPRNPTHSNGSSSSSMQYKQSTSPQPAQPPTGQAVPSSQYQPHQPPSSPVSTNSPSTPPPTTPNLHAPSGSVELESPSIAVQSSEASLYTDRTHYDPQFPPASAPRRPSKGYLYTKPSGGRPINKLDGPRRPRTVCFSVFFVKFSLSWNLMIFPFPSLQPRIRMADLHLLLTGSSSSLQILRGMSQSTSRE